MSNGDCGSLDPISPNSIEIYTRNITRNPIAWNPTTQRPTQELVHSIHSALHFALDPCLNHPDEKPSFCTISVPSSRTRADSEQVNGSTGKPTKWERKIVVPCVDDLVLHPDAQARMSSGELNVKLFAGFDGEPLSREHVADSIHALRQSTGAICDVNKFVVSLEGVKWSGARQESSSEGEAGNRPTETEHIDGMRDAWEYLSEQPQIQELGVADFSEVHLRRLLKLVDLKRCSRESCHCDMLHTRKGSVLSTIKRPVMDQLNFDDDEPPSLAAFASHEGIRLVSHSDDLGTQRQLYNVLMEFKDILPLPSPQDDSDLRTVFKLSWVLKYTVLLPERGLVADKGYIIGASFPSVHPH